MRDRGLLRRRAVLGAGAAGALAAAGCGTVRPGASPGAAAPGDATATLHVLALGWHTEVVLPVRGGGPLAAVERAHPGARHLAFGFGLRDFFTAAAPDLGDYLLGLMPGPAAVLAVPLPVAPDVAMPAAESVALRVTPAGLDGAARFVRDHIAVDAATGAPVSIGPAPWRGGVFYASPVRYALTYTCNTWTADALAAAGLPVSADGVVFAGQMMERARAAAAAQARA